MLTPGTFYSFDADTTAGQVTINGAAAAAIVSHARAGQLYRRSAEARPTGPLIGHTESAWAIAE